LRSHFEFGGITTSEMPARDGLNMSAKLRSRGDTLHNWLFANSLTSSRRPSTPSTLPTQIIWSTGGASRASLPFLSARISGAPRSCSASPTLMPTSALSAVTVSSITSPSMP
jgi:hypothetical protein